MRPGEGSQQVRKERDLVWLCLILDSPCFLTVHTHRDCMMLAAPLLQRSCSLGAKGGEAGKMAKGGEAGKMTEVDQDSQNLGLSRTT